MLMKFRGLLVICERPIISHFKILCNCFPMAFNDLNLSTDVKDLWFALYHCSQNFVILIQ